MDLLGYIVTAVAAYLLGSIPTGYLVARTKGVDIRTVGSGNIGATNAFRVLGPAAGAFVLVADGLKGYAASAWLSPCVVNLMVGQVSRADSALEGLRILAGLCAILGHNYTCWLQFKGGKGIATSAGVFFALAPLAAGIALGAWIVVFAVSRYVSLASIASAVALPTAVWLVQDSTVLGIITTAIGALAIYKHKANIQRLLAGTETRVGSKKTADASPAAPTPPAS